MIRNRKMLTFLFQKWQIRDLHKILLKLFTISQIWYITVKEKRQDLKRSCHERAKRQPKPNRCTVKDSKRLSKIARAFNHCKNNLFPTLSHLYLCIPIFFDNPFHHGLCGHDMTFAIFFRYLFYVSFLIHSFLEIPPFYQ